MSMQKGKSLADLAATLSEVRRDARDFVVPTSRLVADVDQDNQLVLQFKTANPGSNVPDLNVFRPNLWSAGQVASYADIPKAYFDRIVAQDPKLAALNVNHALRRAPEGERRLVRSVDNNLRALLSPKYRRIDSADLAEAVLPTLLDAGMEVVSSDLTDRRFYLRATTPRFRADVSVGDTVQAGIMISNSDVGAGSFRVEPFLVRLLCLNGMVREHAFRKAHLGRSLAGGEDSIELLTEETIRLGEKAFWAEVKDVVAASLLPEVFEREVDKLRDATKRTIKNFDLEEVVDLTMKTVGLSGTKVLTGSILDALASGNQGAGLTQWGLANSLTAAASDASLSFDQGIELERAGGAVIDLTEKQWNAIAQKKAA